MKLSIVLSILIAGCAAHLSPALPAASPEVGYVDLQRVADESAFGRRVSADIQADHAREATTVAEAEKKKDRDAPTMRAQLPKNDQARYAAGIEKVRRRVGEICDEIRVSRHLREVKVRPADVLSAEGDMTDEAIRLIDNKGEVR